MKNIIRRLLIGIVISMVTTTWAEVGTCQPRAGDSAPIFSLSDTKGESHDLSQMKKQIMHILYFFDAASRPSQEGLLQINKLAGKYSEADMTVWGITTSPKVSIDQFIEMAEPQFPILMDTHNVSDLYQARMILPTICIIGPDLKILDFFQGGGKTTEIMLIRLAERQMQRRQPLLAKAISDEVVKQNPANIKARVVKGYVAINEGDYKNAEDIFQYLTTQEGEGEVLGQEGLAAVYASKGESDKALEIIAEVEKKAPERAYPHVIKGNLLYSQNKKSEAEQEYQKAIQKKEAENFQKAIAYNQYGRLNAAQGKLKKSRKLYDQAIAIDPYYIEATSNKGLTYEKEGDWSKALETYRQALNLDKNDTFSAVLAKKAEEMLASQGDIEKKKRIDSLVKELADRFKSQEKSLDKRDDLWTSQPMILTFVDFLEKGGLSERDGFSIVLTSQLGSELNSSGRVQVVERVLLERLLEELNLGSSDLADPETALQLGKVLAAKVIGTGSLYYLPDSTLLSLRLVDTETSAIPKVITRQLDSRASLDTELHKLNREILKTIMLKYPLQGYIVQATNDKVLVNLGSDQGVVLGTKFEVIEEQDPIIYKNKKLDAMPKNIGQIEITSVEPGLSYAHIISQERPFKTDDKIKEYIETQTTL